MRHNYYVSRLIFQIYKSALRTEREFCLRSFTTTRDIDLLEAVAEASDVDLLEAVAEAKIAIRRLIDERNDAHVWESLFDKACEIALDFEIEVSRPRIVGRQRNKSELSHRQTVCMATGEYPYILSSWIF